MEHNISFSTFILSALLLSSCNGGVTNDKSIQITDVIDLEGSFDDNFLESWDYIMLEDDNLDGILASTYKVLYNDGLFFIDSKAFQNYSIKVFDSTGHYLNNIGNMGRARNEFLNIDEWTIDPYRNEVILLNRKGYYASVTIKRFDYQGNYIGQTETSPLTDQYHIGQVIKCMPDGSILIENNLGFTPVYEYFYIHPDGTFSTPMELNMNQMNVDEEGLKMLKRDISLAGDWCGLQLREAFHSIQSDTTLIMPKLESHIYSLYGDGYKCVANLSCLPQIPDKKKNNLAYDSFSEDDDLSSVYEYKDYLYLLYNDDTEYVLEKSTNKMYRMKKDRSKKKKPFQGPPAINGNDLIFPVSTSNIRDELESIAQNSCERSYTPDVMEFFQKTKDHENPIIVIAHYRKPEQDR